jgi:beta-ketoacyl synthase-like protein
MDLSFCVRGWSAWAPGLNSVEQWRAWAAAPSLPFGEDTPVLADVPALQRRRLSRLGRAVLQVAVAAQPDCADIPMVFASRYGDVDRALGAIASLEDGEPLSPTVFAGSVHNAIGAMHSIIGGRRENLVCVASGAHSAAAGVVEAVALLADGADEVLLACYDEPLPPPYEHFADEPQALYAWAWRLAAPTPGAPAWRLARTPSNVTTTRHASLPAGLGVLHWFLAEPSALVQQDGAMSWSWGHDA